MRGKRQFFLISASHLISAEFIIQCNNSQDWQELLRASPESSTNLDQEQVNKMLQATYELSSRLA